MTRQLVILGTSVTLPDPGSVSDLAARFAEQGDQLADLETSLQSLTKPEAWASWTGQAADAFGQSIGQVPGAVGEVRDAYDSAAAALRQYANQLEPVVSSLSSLYYPAEEAESTLASVKAARNRAIASGQNPVTTGWDARLADATAEVSALRSQLNRLLGELTALAAACTRQIKAAEPATAHKSLFGTLESGFMRDVADPVGHDVKDLGKGVWDVVKEAGKVEGAGAIALFEALYVHPLTDLVKDATRNLDAAKLSDILGDVAGVLGILALVPGIDVVAVPAALIVGAAAAGVEWYAAAHHEQGASYAQAGLDTVTLALSGVGLVAKGVGDAADAGKLANNADAADSGQALWLSGAKQAFAPLVNPRDAVSESLAKEHATTLPGFDKALVSNVRKTTAENFVFPSGGSASSPAVVTITRVGWTADRLSTLVTTGQDINDHPGSEVP